MTIEPRSFTWKQVPLPRARCWSGTGCPANSAGVKWWRAKSETLHPGPVAARRLAKAFAAPVRGAAAGSHGARDDGVAAATRLRRPRPQPGPLELRRRGRRRSEAPSRPGRARGSRTGSSPAEIDGAGRRGHGRAEPREALQPAIGEVPGRDQRVHRGRRGRAARLLFSTSGAAEIAGRRVSSLLRDVSARATARARCGGCDAPARRRTSRTRSTLIPAELRATGCRTAWYRRQPPGWSSFVHPAPRYAAPQPRARRAPRACRRAPARRGGARGATAVQRRGPWRCPGLMSRQVARPAPSALKPPPAPRTPRGTRPAPGGSPARPAGRRRGPCRW